MGLERLCLGPESSVQTRRRHRNKSGTFTYILQGSLYPLLPLSSLWFLLFPKS